MSRSSAPFIIPVLNAAKSGLLNSSLTGSDADPGANNSPVINASPAKRLIFPTVKSIT